MSTLGVIAMHVGRALRPLRTAISSDSNFVSFANRLGFTVTVMPDEYKPLRQLLDDLLNIAEKDEPDVNDLVGALKDVYNALSTNLPEPDGGSSSDIGLRLIEVLLADYLASTLPSVYNVLRTIGLIQAVPVNATAQRPAFLETRFDYDAIPRFLTTPADVIKALVAWGASDYAFWRISEWLLEFLVARGIRAHLHAPDDDTADGFIGDSNLDPEHGALTAVFMDGLVEGQFIELGFTLMNLPGADPGFILQPLIPKEITIPLGGDFSIDAKTNVTDLFGVLIRPSGLEVKYPFAPGSTAVPTASVDLSFSPAQPRVLLGDAAATRLELKGAKLGVGVEAGTDVSAEAETIGMQLVVEAGDTDGFVSALLGDNTITVPLSVGLRWSALKGFSFSGSGKFEITLSPDLTLGPVTIDTISVAISGKPSTPAPDSQPTTLTTVVGLGVSASLGPVDVVIDQIGVALNFLAKPGILGPYDLDVGFKFPKGVGVSIDAGSVSGGGFISFDPDAGRYSGALELSIYDIAVKAFGLIETKVPGVDFSFVVVISAEFTPIQLGFGFTLNGVGGLVGINRTVDSNALANLVKAGQSEELLFPKNLIQNAPTIIRDLGTVFPARQGHYIFGPLAKLGWGTPTLITGELGIILEIPGPVVVLLGEIKCLLPKPDAALVKMNLSIGGTLDFPNKKFSLDAMLHDSSIESYPISGQMAFRLSWGEQPNFALSIGGFHPAYQPPKDFPKLQPLALDLGQHGAATITVSGFFAVTSNTVQVGGDARLHAGGSGITLDASVSVKALFVFSPFHFAANIDAGVKISFHGYGPSVHLSGTLEGPSPWHIKGEVCVSIVFWDACLGFDETFGGGDAQPSVPELDPWDPAQTDASLIGLKAALQDAGNWSGVLPGGTANVISRAQGTEALVDPLGGLSVHQKAVPVETDQPISRFGVAKVTNPIPYVLNTASFGNGVTLKKLGANKDFFAPAQYFQMDDGKKLSSSGFEQRQSGYVFGENDNNVRAGSNAPKTLTYDTFLIAGDGTISPEPVSSYEATNDHVTGVNKRSAVVLGGATQSGTRRFIDRLVTQAFQVNQPTFVLSSTSALTALAAVDGGITATTRSAALLALDALRSQNPALRLQVQVSASHELA
jgi:hypothetical protein